MRFEVAEIGGGWQGTDDTVERIYQLVDESLTDPLVVRTARSLVRNVTERDQAAESRAISEYVRSHIRYTKESIETLAAPGEMIRDIEQHGRTTGDCDEFTTLSLALHKAIGIPVRAVVISQRKDKMGSHIFGQALIKGRGWVTMDDIVKTKPYGWEAPAKSRTKTKNYGVSGLGGLGCPERIDSSEEGFGMADTMMIGRTRVIRADQLTPAKRRMIGPSVASRGFQLKPSGMLYVDRAGGLSGVGVDPELGFIGPLISAVTSIASAGADVYGKLKEAKAKVAAIKKPTPAPAAAAPAQAAAQEPAEYTTGAPQKTNWTPVLLALGALFLLSKKR